MLTSSHPQDFHCTMAISKSYVDRVDRSSALSSRTLYHITKAYGLVNSKLSSNDFISDKAIAAVVSLAIYQQIHHQYAVGLVHLHGLYRMIELRGGITQLVHENPALSMKPIRYVDILHCTLSHILLPLLIISQN